jgi:molybdopterin-containing oxidoreductase family membrane subunit
MSMSVPTRNEEEAGSREEARMVESVVGASAVASIPRWWILALGMAMLLFGVLDIAVVWLFYEGTGVWGIREPSAWGFAIVNFVWWVGIGHAGTFISAILFLVKQDWRNSINRMTEGMTLAAVSCAGLFPLLHLGRPWIFYWLVPYPNSLDMWPQFRSPLIWDFVAVSVYAAFSVMFWYVGLLPDLATMRDRSPRLWQRVVYGVMALGWRGSIGHWQRYRQLYVMMAGIATALVVSVHSIVSLDFAVSIVPGWHSTIFPPYFFAGALFSGFAMVLTLLIPLRTLLGWERFFTMRHFDNLAKLLLLTGLVIDHGYVMELFSAFYSGDPYEIQGMRERLYGVLAPMYWTMVALNVGVLQALWFPAVRRCLPLLFFIAIAMNMGIWLDQYLMVTGSLDRNYLPSSWGWFVPTLWDWATLLGSLGLFLGVFLLLTRLFPALSMHELGPDLRKQAEAAR